MKKIAFFMVVAMMVMTSFAMAGTEAGNKEVQVQGSHSILTNSESESETYTTNMQISLNYFFTSWFSIGGTWRGSGTISRPESGEESETTSNFLLVRGDFYLGKPTSKAVVYFGGQVGQSMYYYQSGQNSNSGSTAAFGIHGGLKFFATENTSWNLEIDSTEYTPEVETSGPNITYTNTSLMAGFSYYF